MILIVIPARLESTRLPRKPLALIGNYPMLWWVHECARKSLLADHIIVATDSEQIVETMEAYGAKALPTTNDCHSGSDRVWQAAQKFPEAQIIINLQGDEPLMPTSIIDGVISLLLNNPNINIASACMPFHQKEDRQNPHQVKTIFSKNRQALYFSRAALAGSYLHLGIYGFRRAALERFCALEPAVLEKEEKLEQLRALENDMPIHLHCAESQSMPVFGIDTENDLLMATKILIK